jgi:hypothetical protein
MGVVVQGECSEDVIVFVYCFAEVSSLCGMIPAVRIAVGSFDGRRVDISAVLYMLALLRLVASANCSVVP